jgi:hypothetical protein
MPKTKGLSKKEKRQIKREKRATKRATKRKSYSRKIKWLTTGIAAATLATVVSKKMITYPTTTKGFHIKVSSAYPKLFTAVCLFEKSLWRGQQLQHGIGEIHHMINAVDNVNAAKELVNKVVPNLWESWMEQIDVEAKGSVFTGTWQSFKNYITPELFGEIKHVVQHLWEYN